MIDSRAHLRPSRYLVVSPPARIEGGKLLRVVLATRTGTTLHVGSALWDAIHAGCIEEIPNDLIASLIEARVLVDSRSDELAEVVADNRASIASNDVLELVIQPTAACQLGCGYCGQEHRAVVMDDRVQDALIASIASRIATARTSGRHYSQFHVGWFGAEPLLGLSAMRRLTPLLRELARAEGATITAHVVTNGLGLTASVARELVLDLDVDHVEVTLDGPPDVHDKRRHTKSGHATFEQIWSNLLAVAADDTVDFELTLRCNVDATNADAVPELIDRIATSPLALRTRLYFSPVYAWGNEADQLALDLADYGQREVAWMSQQIAAGMPVHLVPGRRAIVCVAVQPDARVVDAYGSEFTCTEVPYVPAYGTPNRYETGQVQVTVRRSGRVPDPLPFANFNDNITDGTVGCARCPLLPVCGGACPKAWLDGRVPCPSHKTNLSDRLLLELAHRRLTDPVSG